MNDVFVRKNNNNNLIIINLDLHNKTSGNNLYAIIQPNNDQSNQLNYKWRMVEISEATAISDQYGVNNNDLPLSSRDKPSFRKQLSQQIQITSSMINDIKSISLQILRNKSCKSKKLVSV